MAIPAASSATLSSTSTSPVTRPPPRRPTTPSRCRSPSGGTTSTLATYSNLNKGTGYVARSVNLSAYAGKTVTVKFLGVEDSSAATSFLVDDTSLTTG